MNDRLRVMARLVDAHHGFEFWSQRYDRDITDVFALQDDISRAIADKLAEEAARDHIGISVRDVDVERSQFEPVGV